MKRNRSIVAVALAAACVVACGGEDRGRPSGAVGAATDVPAPDPCHAADGWETLAITSFEPRNSVSRFTSCTGAGCSFYFSYDTLLSPAKTVGLPVPGYPGCKLPPVCPPGTGALVTSVEQAETQLVAEPLDGGRCGVPGSAFHYTGKDLAVCSTQEIGRPGWGGGLNITLVNNDETKTFDASAWDGISFWVRKGAGPSKSSLIFLVADGYTSNILTPCDVSDPSCGSTVPDTDKCDPFGQAVTLTSDWTFYAVRFSTLRQKGFGKPSPHGAIDTSTLKRLQFSFTAGDWDFFIDDINFFRVPRPQ
jgi:hypothetical protein